MATIATSLTVEQFEKIPYPLHGYHELHHGGLILMPPPKKGHAAIQRRLLTLLETHCASGY